MSAGHRVLKNTALLSIGQITTLVTGIIWTAVLARYIGPQTYGIYAYAQSILTILVIFVNLGIEQLLIRDVAQKPAVGARYLATAVAVKSLLSLPILGGFLAYGQVMGWSGEWAAIVTLVAASTFVGAIGAVLSAVLYAHEAMYYDTISQVLRAILALIAGVSAVWLRQPFPIILGILLGTLVLQGGLKFYFVSKVIDSTSQEITKAMELSSLRFAAQLMRKSIPFAALSAISVLYTNMVIVLLGNLVHDDTVVGNFAAAQRIYTLIFIVPNMLMQAVFPTFSSAYTKSRERFAAMFERAYRYLFMVTAPMAVGLWITAPLVINLIYGAEFSSAGSPLRILSLVLLNGVGFVMGPAMMAMNRQTLYALIFGSGVVSVYVVGYWAIPLWGVDGASWAIVAGAMVGFVVYAILLFRWLNLRYPFMWAAKTVAASIGMGLVVYLFIPYVHFLVASFLIAPPVYLFLHLWFRTFSGEDQKYLRHLLPEAVWRATTTLFPKWKSV